MEKMSKINISSHTYTTLFNRPKDSHKGTFGHLFVLAGSPGMTGAASLTSLAALKSGCGMVTLGIPESLLSIMEIKLTEVIKKPLPETKDRTLSLSSFSDIKKFSQNCTALAIGPGLSRQKETQKLIRKIIVELDIDMLIDADAINALEGHIAILKKMRRTLALTPHPAEIGRLIKKSASFVQKNRATLTKSLTNDYNIILILKGYKTLVVKKDDFYTNKTGNPGMATAGVGDVLTGMIGSFLAQGIEKFEAAKLGVCLHGLAADLAVKDKGELSLIASDLIDYLPLAFERLKKML
jgi:NAD(P)H-hydrate epimerase